ncbi:MAG: hypothetical protein ACRESU_02565 [Gammaproteobacteria bacterium]
MKMDDPYEIFVEWYLRLNGYLSVKNFVIHEPKNNSVPQGGEIDILGVRFPYSCEKPLPDFKFNVDNNLIDEKIISGGITDFVIAEVKSSNDTINDLWRQPPNQENCEELNILSGGSGFVAQKK